MVFMENEKTPEKVLEDITSKDSSSPKKNPNLNKQLFYVLLSIGIFIMIILAMPSLIRLTKQFNYHGVKFEKMKKGELTLYNTQVPLYDSSGKKYGDYNFYLRNDPRDLENISFNGTLYFTKNVVINATQEFRCDAYRPIAFDNLRQLYTIIGADVIKDPNATCDSLGRYTYLNVKPGNETKIEQVGPACYDLVVGDCEVLKTTERFMDEMFVKINNISKTNA